MAQLPPLNALKAFEAVARLQSFTKAAEELFVTRAAISHQIRHLEDFLGFPLIKRHNRSISLTPAGAAALPKLREGFNNLADAVHEMHSQVSQKTLNVWIAPSFASKWLVPRLHLFSNAHPDIEMRISGDAKLIDATEEGENLDELFRTNDIDVMIRFGSGNYPNCDVAKLFSVYSVPLCNPELLNDPEKPLKKPADLIHHTLLHDETPYTGRPNWSKWAEKFNVDDIDFNRGLHFNQVSLGLAAAVDGQGILLSIDALAEYDIAAGRLCIPLEQKMPLDHAYYVIRPKGTSTNQKSANTFIDWILSEAAKLHAHHRLTSLQ
ncbi:MAG: Glycine cleavage system transcriptional activator GcvA [uncultured Thiotrichaceae bacterium]|uniref:Glycine cleavage system transcriptional activator GcvA n=1 Tax=uncultured Thiotrichaceae bacterium TaxID=298394 RepID=A0A6S6S654_9GAMM|nr:MAG: Glycine cleavage system transcriptional activator GcvA [uncultured Thiotrichaceae bacterium]